jgi:hypothetical protein
MSLSMYDASVPMLKQMLGATSDILGKAAAFAAAKKIDESVLLGARLAPDMFALTRQVQIATDQSKGGIARLAGVEIPKYEDSEATIAALQERLAKTIAFMESAPVDAINASASNEIVLKIRDNELRFTGSRYLLGWVIPNVMFHVTTTYNILRHNGVEIGKRDFLGAF